MSTGLSLAQFWDATPAELAFVFRAHAKRVRRQYEALAWHLAPILNMVSKGRVRPRDLLPSSGGVVDVGDYGSVEEVRAAIAIRRQESVA